MTVQNIGALAGHFSINSDGAAVYQIPLPLPPGTAGMGPSLSLVYNSGGPNGILGMGWQLAGLSTISRVGRTPAQDGAHGAVLYDDNDRFTLDGTRLVPVHGNYGDTDAVYHTEIERWSKVTPTYGTKPPSGRSGPDSFTVVTKTGVVQQYGTTSGSQVVASSDNPSIRVWALSRSTDRNGNFMTVTYNTADGAYAPDQIHYAGNGDDVAPQRLVQFCYEDRPDAFTHYVGGHPVITAQRLKKIEVSVTQQGITTKVMSYHFCYQPGTGTGRSQLKSVTQHDGAGNTLSPTHFTWQQGTAQPLSSQAAPPIQTAAYGTNNFLPFDIDGGGRLGFIYPHSDPNTEYLAVDLYPSSPGGLTGPVATPVEQAGLYFSALLDANNIPQIFPVDVDGNGCTDLVCATADENSNLALTVFMATFVATPAPGSWTLQLAGSVKGALSNSQVPWGASLYPADVNGDGATDFVAVSDQNGTAQFWVLSNVAGLYQAQPPASFSFGGQDIPSGGQGIPIDIDGDGQTDFVYAYDNGSNQLQIAVLRSNGSGLESDPKLPLLSTTLAVSSCALTPLDVNGDGLVDLVHVAADETTNNVVLTVLINTGAGFVQQSQTPTTIPFGETPILAPADVNGDGLTDLIAAVPFTDPNTGDEYAQLQILLSTGSGFTPAPGPAPAVLNAVGAPMLPLDLAGVGMSGVVLLQTVGGNALNVLSIAPAGPFPDLMVGVTDGLGGQYAINYLPLTDPSVYSHTPPSPNPLGTPSLNPLGMLGGGSQGATFQPSTSTSLQPGTAAAVAPARIVTVPKYVPASYVKSDGNGGNYSYSYNYSNAKVDVAHGRGWLGFATQTCVDGDVGSISSTAFGQDFPLTGTVVSHSISRASDQALMVQSTLCPQVLQPYPNVAQVVVKQSQTQLYTFGRLDATRTIITTYDPFGNPQTIADQWVADQWDGTGAALYTTNAFNNDTTNAFNDDLVGWIIGQPSGATQYADAANTQILTQWKKTYDPETGNLTQYSVWHDQAGVFLNTAYTSYDRFGNCKSEAAVDGSETDWTYEPDFNTFIASVTDPPTDAKLRLTTRYEYEPVFGMVLNSTDANGVVTKQEIDGFGRIVGKWATDPNGKLVQVTKVAMSQDAAGGIYRETDTALDWAGATWTWRRDYLDGLKRVYRTVTLGADGVASVNVDRAFNSKNQVLSESLPYFQGSDAASALATTFIYDALNRVVRQTKPADGGATSITTFDYPNVSTTVQTEAVQIEAVHTAAGGSTAPRRTTTLHGTFNGKSRVLQVTDATKATATFQYDPLGQLTGVTDAAGTPTSMTFDSLGQKTGFTTTTNGNTLRSEASQYDLMNRVVTTTDSRQQTVTQTRDALGRLTSKIDGQGNRTSFEYDTAPNFGLHRLAALTTPDGSRYAFDYDPAGNQTSIVATIGGQTYPPLARTFLPSGKVQQQTFPDGAVQTNVYTPGGRLSAITIAEGGSTVASLAFTNYNAFGKPGMLTNDNGVTEKLDYNAIGQLHQQTIESPSGLLSQDVFLWNLLDDLQSIKDRLHPTQNYSFDYDAAGRLKKADGPFANPQAFEYDAAGNLTNKAGVAFEYQNGALKTAGATMIKYDAAANPKEIIANGSTTELDYDADGRLSQAGNTSFTYDQSGRRLSKSTPGGTTTYYVTPGYEVTKLPNGAVQHTKYLRSPLGLGASITTAHQPGAGAGAPLPGVPAPGVCYFHRNQVNSTTLVTDGKGKLQASVSYLPFGEIASLTGSDTFRAKFAGRELDQETGLSYFGARYYSAEFGRFISPDDRLGGRLGLRDIANVYAYVLNGPVCHVDPTGHNFWEDFAHGARNFGSEIGRGVAGGFESVGEQIKSTAKSWAPYVVDGVLIVGGIALIATGVGAIVGTGLLAAGLTGLAYTVQSGGNFSWEHWGVQLAIGFAVGAAGAGAGAIADEVAAGVELGSAERIAFMAYVGALTGAAGNAVGTVLTNLDNGKSASQGVGWAAVVGAGTGGAAGALGEGLSGTFSEEAPSRIIASDDEDLVYVQRPGTPGWLRTRVVKPGVGIKFIVKSPPLWFGIGGKALIAYGPQWTW
jgi:RHS repeat-associated protein